MPLAGKMKLNTFLALVGGVSVVGLGAGGYAVSQLESPEVTTAPEPAPKTPVRPVARTGPDKVLLARIRQLGGQPMAEAKAKDVLSGPGNPKVNLYKDDGKETINRLKVDWDRDERWDEKWTWEDDGSISRQVAGNDDEVYDTTLHWSGSAWSTTVSAAPTLSVPPPESAPAPPAPSTDGGVVGPAAAINAFMLTRQGKDLGTKKVKDASKGTAWKVNLYQDDGEATMNRAKVDLDRDDKWDEKWTFAPDGLSKQVSPDDDENYTETWVYDGTRWNQDDG